MRQQLKINVAKELIESSRHAVVLHWVLKVYFLILLNATWVKSADFVTPNFCFGVVFAPYPYSGGAFGNSCVLAKLKASSNIFIIFGSSSNEKLLNRSVSGKFFFSEDKKQKEVCEKNPGCGYSHQKICVIIIFVIL